jgi:hypothetical protein
MNTPYVLIFVVVSYAHYDNPDCGDIHTPSMNIEFPHSRDIHMLLLITTNVVIFIHSL